MLLHCFEESKHSSKNCTKLKSANNCSVAKVLKCFISPTPLFPSCNTDGIFLQLLAINPISLGTEFPLKQELIDSANNDKGIPIIDHESQPINLEPASETNIEKNIQLILMMLWHKIHSKNINN